MGQETNMTRFAKILVPVDFSEGSKNTARCAVSFAKDFQSELTLFHVVEIGTYGTHGPENFWTSENVDLIRKAANQEMEAFVQTLGNEYPLSVKMDASPHRAEDVICEEAKKTKTDLIIMSTHGRSGLDHLLLGSVAERVIRQAHCPVLTFRLPCSRS